MGVHPSTPFVVTPRTDGNTTYAGTPPAVVIHSDRAKWASVQVAGGDKTASLTLIPGTENRPYARLGLAGLDQLIAQLQSARDDIADRGGLA